MSGSADGGFSTAGKEEFLLDGLSPSLTIFFLGGHAIYRIERGGVFFVYQFVRE